MRRLSHRNDQARLNGSKRYRTGFTLVELLVVIAIIGVLVGLTVPAVFAVRKTFNNASVKFEVQALADAVEKYRTKHGDYPPDGSSWPVMEAHFRKVFPNILQSELNLLNPAYRNVAVPGHPALTSGNKLICNDYDGGVMDPAEALVFFLGGFSSDTQKPFTGKGGPFGQNYVFNPSRDNSFYEFTSSRLNGADDEWRESNATLFPGNDSLPVYASYQSQTPYVYFDSRSFGPLNYYRTFALSDAETPAAVLMGVARPLLTVSPASFKAKPSEYFENSKTFQIISPGVDGLYGWQYPNSTFSGHILFSSSGQGYSFNGNAQSGSSPWVIDSLKNRFRLFTNQTKYPMLDNSSNCIDNSVFGDQQL